MQLSNILFAAIAALSVSAAPDYSYPRCHGDMEWDPIQKLCKCDRGEYYDAEAKGCRIREVKEIESKSCREGEKLYCVRGEGDYVPYDRHSAYCLDDKHSKLICAKKNRVTEVFKHVIRKEYEHLHVAAEENERKRISCEKPRYYNYETRVCECPRNKIWNGYDCGFPVLEKPVCSYGERAFCAKDSRHIILYAKQEKLCENNGKNYVFCCGGDRREARSCLAGVAQQYI